MIPLLIAGAAAAAFGAYKHHDAKETNEFAQARYNKAQEKYEESKSALESAQEGAKDALQTFGNSKMRVLENSMARFLNGYDRIKHIVFTDSDMQLTLGECFDETDALQVSNMQNIYSGALASGAAGAATGLALGFAAGGGLALLAVGGEAIGATLSMAGAMASMGTLSGVIGAAGFALEGIGGVVASTLPGIGLIAAPIAVFTGLSASAKADKNYHEARMFEAEVEKTCEEMETAKTLCNAIRKRADMFWELLEKLDIMFNQSADWLDSLTSQRIREIGDREIRREDFTREEWGQIAVSRSLAKAVKTVLDVPLLDDKGNLTHESEKVYESSMAQLPALTESCRN